MREEKFVVENLLVRIYWL